jgi:hypothetical protein
VSKADLLNSDVLKAVERTEKYLDQLILSGIAEVLVQKDGCLVAVVHNQWNMTTLRRLVSAIGAATHNHFDYFEYAEVEDG